jgi:hypothetical protein
MLVSCASLKGTSMQYAGAPHPPPTSAADVEILRVEPRKPHYRVGEVEVDASLDPAPSIEKVEQKLREEAAKIGADAVVIIYDRVHGGAYVRAAGWGRSRGTSESRAITGIAIKYRS